MRIWAVAACPFPAGRGSQLLVERTSQALRERGHAVRLFCHRYAEAGREPPRGLALSRAGLPRWGRAPRSDPELLRAVDDACLVASILLTGARPRARPDVLLGHNVTGAIAAGLAARALGLPALYLRHNDFGLELASRGRLAGALGRTADALAGLLASRSVSLHPAPRDDALPPPGDPDERPISPGDGNTLYYEGNDDAYQNPRWLGAALHAARCAHPHADVRLVRAAGPVARPDQADLGLVPRSLPGGFPMKLLAYQLAGLPAVCVESGAPGAVDGVDAFVVPGAGSPESFAARVVEALGDPAARQRVAAQARDRALARCHPAVVGKRLESLLEELRAAGRGRQIYIGGSNQENADPPP